MWVGAEEIVASSSLKRVSSTTLEETSAELGGQNGVAL